MFLKQYFSYFQLFIVFFITLLTQSSTPQIWLQTRSLWTGRPGWKSLKEQREGSNTCMTQPIPRSFTETSKHPTYYWMRISIQSSPILALPSSARPETRLMCPQEWWGLTATARLSMHLQASWRQCPMYTASASCSWRSSQEEEWSIILDRLRSKILSLGYVKIGLISSKHYFIQLTH